MVARKTSTVNYSRHLEALGSSPRLEDIRFDSFESCLLFGPIFGGKWLQEQRNLGGL